METQKASPCRIKEKINMVNPLDSLTFATSEQSELPTTPHSKNGRISYRSVAVIWLSTRGARRKELCSVQAGYELGLDVPSRNLHNAEGSEAGGGNWGRGCTYR